MSKLVPLSEYARVNPPRDTQGLGLSATISFISMNDVSESGEWLSRATRKHSDVRSGYTSFLEGDILFAKITPCMENGKGAHALGLWNGVGFGSTEFHVLRAGPQANARFVFHWTQSDQLRKKAEAFMIGSAGQRRVPASFFESFEVAHISLPEQQHIAEILDTLNEAIRRSEQVIAKLQQVKQGLLHDLLTRGIDEHGELRDPDRHPEQFKDSELGRLPRGWEAVALSTVASVDRGKFAHRPRNDPRFYGGRHPFIQTGDVAAANGAVLSEASQSLNERGARVSLEFPAGTIAITIAANIADTAILGIPMFFPDSVVGAVVRPNNDIRWIELCVRNAKARLSARAPQSAQKNINLKDLRPLRIPLPSEAEQRRCATLYEDADARIGSSIACLDKLRALKAGLMHDLLTGRVRTLPP